MNEPHVAVQSPDGNVHVIPDAVIEAIVAGDMKLMELEHYEPIMQKVLAEWFVGLRAKEQQKPGFVGEYPLCPKCGHPVWDAICTECRCELTGWVCLIDELRAHVELLEQIGGWVTDGSMPKTDGVYEILWRGFLAKDIFHDGGWHYSMPRDVAGWRAVDDDDALRAKMAQGAPVVKDPDLENRFTYHAPKTGQAKLYTKLRDTARRYAYLIKEAVPGGREQSLALTKLEETVMWANAGIARARTDGGA